MYRRIINGLQDAWSATNFVSDEVAFYAQKMTLKDARQGLTLLSLMLLGVFAVEVLLHGHFHLHQAHVYTCSLLALLCIHVAASSRVLRDTRSVYLLGATLLMISGTAFILLAHKTGTLSLALFASVTMLFMVIPLVPWGLREGLAVAALIYATFTVSTWSSPTSFESEALWTLQFIMVGAGVISLALVMRNASARKADIRARFDLEAAHQRLLQLSNRDPLTGAWNRRYLKEQFPVRLGEWQAAGRTAYFALLDLDDFKPINDTCGHDYGDMVLRCVTRAFTEQFQDDGFLVRMGGDEFALFCSVPDPEGSIARAVQTAGNAIAAARAVSGLKFNMSIGLIAVPPDLRVSQETVYRDADAALYRAKDRKMDVRVGLNLVSQTAAGT